MSGERTHWVECLPGRLYAEFNKEAPEERKSRMKIDTVTSNEAHVRLEIFEGRLPLSEGGAELIRLAQSQLLAAEKRAHEWMERAVRAEMELSRLVSVPPFAIRK